MSRTWGLLCPEGHGLLVQREDWTTQAVAWCPHEDHGGNGRFWRLNEAEEGWFDPTRAPILSAAQIERQRISKERTAEWAAIHKTNEEKRKMTEQKTEKPVKIKAEKVGQECLCGCKGMTKGGRFLPGHDARYHAAQKRAAAAAAGTPEPIKTRAPRAAKPKPVDLTAKAEDTAPDADTFEV